MIFCRLLIFFKINFFEKVFQKITSECQTVWIQIRPDIMSGLIWIQTVCIGYQQTELVPRKNSTSGITFTLFYPDEGRETETCRYLINSS